MQENIYYVREAAKKSIISGLVIRGGGWKALATKKKKN